MMLSHPFNQGCRTPISLLPMTSRPLVRHSLRHNLLTQTSTSTITHRMNPRNATGRETADHTQGLTILWNEMTLIITFPLPPIHTPYPFRPQGLQDLHLSKRRAFPVAKIEDLTTTRGWVLQRIWVATDLRGILLCITSSTTGTENDMDRQCLSTFQHLARSRLQVAYPRLRLRGTADIRDRIRARTYRLS